VVDIILNNLYENYFSAIREKHETGQTTEQSFYNALETFAEQISAKLGTNVIIIQIPKKTEGGLPDFLVLRKIDKKIIGYIEAKPLGTDLSVISKTPQLERYKESFQNLVLTNYSFFVFFRNGERIDEVRLHGLEAFLETGQMTLDDKDIKAFENNMNDFLSFTYRRLTTPKALAVILAKKTHILKEVFLEESNVGEETKKEFLLNLFSMFKETLNKSMTLEQFSDLIAQTITYGLFFAKTESKEGDLELEKASWFIPKSIPILQSLFYNLTSPQNISEHLRRILEDIINILNNTDMDAIFRKFHSEKWTDDPSIHFYETFLKEYDPKVRIRKGVFYTPNPVVSYIINSIHLILKEDFESANGLAENNVTLLDPAAGTLTFPLLAIRRIKQELKDQNKEGLFNSIVKEHILRNFYAFELLLAPYTIAHFKASLTLKDLGYNMENEERFNLFLTNTLEKEAIAQRDIYFLPLIAKESREAMRVKEKVPILVVCANPPYSVSSENKSAFIEELMNDYKEDVRKEKNIQPLSDDYIKFIRFAHWKIEQAGEGIIGYITNNEYLGGLIHRGMRKKLLETFDKIYILNLHGDIRKGDTSLRNTTDENVFDITKGVAIALFIKNSKVKQKKVFYSDLIGSREEKYQYLLNNNVLTTKWELIEPREPFYFLVPRKTEIHTEEQYKSFYPITDIFQKYECGVKTHRDKFIVADTKEELKERLNSFLDKEVTDENLKKRFDLKDTGTWVLQEARKELREIGVKENEFRTYDYRPFCSRWTYLSNILVTRPRGEEIHDVNEQNPALVTTRQLAYLPFQHVFVTNKLADICLISLRTKESSYIFPLYLYKGKKRTSNVKDNILRKLKTSVAKDIEPIDIFRYIYAILHATKYRDKYAEFLKISYPRIPFTSNHTLFFSFVRLGEKLINIHFLSFCSEEERNVGYPVDGTNIIEERRYDTENKRIYINKTQFFERISDEEWNFYIGGHQVLDRWLREMKNKRLSLEEIRHFIKIVACIRETIKLMQILDGLYDNLEKSIISTKAIDRNLTHYS